MSGIVFPITLGRGKQAAIRDNQADERFAQDRELNNMRMAGLRTQQQLHQRALAEDTEEAPIRKMKRDAEKISLLAKYAVTNLERVADQDVPAYVAKVMSEMPAFGQVEARGNQLFDGEKTIPMGRAEAEKLLATFADPETALKLKMEEAQYVDAQGNVTTTTAADAQRRGLSRATDVKAGYDLNKARVADQFAEEDAQLGLSVKRANIAQSQAATAKSQQEKLQQYTDGTQVQSMTPEEAKAKGWRLVSDFKTERSLQGGGLEPYEFSKQSPDAATEYAQGAYLQDKGYRTEQYYDPETGITSKRWLTAEGTPVPAEDLQEAVAVSRDTTELLLTGQAKDPADAYAKVSAYRQDMAMVKKFAVKAQQAVAEKRAIVMPNGESKVFSDPQQALEAIISVYRTRQGELGKAKKAGMAALNGQQQ
jgi:hypothetical protein